MIWVMFWGLKSFYYSTQEQIFCGLFLNAVLRTSHPEHSVQCTAMELKPQTWTWCKTIKHINRLQYFNHYIRNVRRLYLQSRHSRHVSSILTAGELTLDDSVITSWSHWIKPSSFLSHWALTAVVCGFSSHETVRQISLFSWIQLKIWCWSITWRGGWKT